MSILERKDQVEYKIREIIKKVDWLAENCPEIFVAYQEYNSNFQVEDPKSLFYEDNLGRLEDLFEIGNYGLSLKLDDDIDYKKIEYEHSKRRVITINLYECEDVASCRFKDSLDPLHDWCRITDEDRLKYLGLFEEEIDKIKTKYLDDKYPQYKLSDFCS